MAGLVAVIYGVVAYGFTLVALLYLIGFVGNLIVPKSIDSGTAGPLLQSVIVDTMLMRTAKSCGPDAPMLASSSRS